MKQNAWQKLDSKINLPDEQPYLKWIRNQLAPYSDSPLQDSLVLLSWATGISKERLFAHPEIKLKNEEKYLISRAVKKYVSGFPIPYITGHREFQKLTFQVNPQVLIPRPETETLVDLASAWLDEHHQANRVLDLGTGSGCIAVSLAKLHPSLQVVATDINFRALLVAKENAGLHDAGDQIQFIQLDLVQGIQSEFDLITANLPYIPREKLAQLDAIRYEPRIALDGGLDGLKWIRKLLQDAPECLKPEGAVLLEIDEETGAEVFNIAREFFPQAKIELEKDLSDMDRFLIIRTNQE